MRFTNRLAAIVAVATCTLGAVLRADILADYRFSSSPTNSEALVTQSTAGAISFNGGTLRSGAIGIGSPLGSMRATANITGSTSATDTAGAITAGDYIGFTLTPNPGYSLELVDLRFSWVIQRDTVGTNTDPSPYTATAFLKSSIGGFTDTDPTLGSVTRSTVYFGIGGAATENAWTDVVFDLSDLPATPTSVQFRIYFADNGSFSNSGIRLDNLLVNGTSTLPEPAGAGLLALGGLLLRRRRRNGRLGATGMI